jgi:hypothetical protein
MQPRKASRLCRTGWSPLPKDRLAFGSPGATGAVALAALPALFLPGIHFINSE